MDGQYRARSRTTAAEAVARGVRRGSMVGVGLFGGDEGE